MTEVLIAGAGATGQAAALGLAGQGRQVRLVERQARAPGSAGRLFTLNWPARRLLARLLAAKLPMQPIRRMRIFAPDGRLLGFDADAAGIACLAATVHEDDLTAALAAARDAAGLAIETNSQVTAAAAEADGWQVTCAGRQIAARLLVAADGAGSPTAAAAGLARTSAGASQQIETGWLEAAGAPAATAWQWFAPFGCLALLPAADGRINFILSRALAAGAPAADAEAIIGDLCRPEIGSWRLLAPPQHFCATCSHSRGSRPRLALIGDCARSIYPLSGQGLAVGLGDVETLLECLAGKPDPGAGAALQRYRRRRALRTGATVQVTSFFARASNRNSAAAGLLSLAARIDSAPATALAAHLANIR